MNGKGSKLRPYNKSMYDSNYSKIDWNPEFVICHNCKKKYKEVDKNKYLVQDDSGDWVCVECNLK